MSKKIEITLGCDPELFVKSIKTGEIVSAEGKIGGTKEEPRAISKKGHSVQEDNVMVEFNIPPSNNADEFIDNINHVLDYLTTYVGKQGLALECKASHMLDDQYLQTEQAKTFGCEPDYNVYLQDENPKVDAKGRLRSCGGHIHIGYPNPNEIMTERIVKAMDIFLGLPSVWLDTDTRRRRLYGTAGSFRFKPFGCEYRTLSNFWVENDNMMRWAYDNTILAVNTALKYDLTSIGVYNKAIQQAINESDVQAARALYRTILAKIKELTKVKKESKKLV